MTNQKSLPQIVVARRDHELSPVGVLNYGLE